MKRLVWLLLLVSLALLTACNGGDRTETVSGYAINCPLNGATVEALGPNGSLGSTTTDTDGRFSIDLPPQSSYRLRVSGGTLDGIPYEGVLEAFCETTECDVTPWSTLVVRLMDELGFNKGDARALLVPVAGFDYDPFTHELHTGEPVPTQAFELEQVRAFLDYGAGVEDWVSDIVAWLGGEDCRIPENLGIPGAPGCGGPPPFEDPVHSAPAQALRIATLAPSGSAWMNGLERGAAEVERATDGRVRTLFFAGGSHGDERNIVRNMRLGQLDGAALTSVGLSMIDESIRVLELPMMFRSVEELDYVRQKMWPHFQEKFESRGFQLGEPGDVGWLHFFSRSPISSLADMRRARIWMWTDDQLVRALFRRLNINGVPLGIPDVLPALQSGRINAAYSAPLATLTLQWNTRIRFMTSMPMSYSIGASVLRNEAYERIPPGDRLVRAEIQLIQSNRLRSIVRQENEGARRMLVRSGVRTVDTHPDMVAGFEKEAQEVWQDLVGVLYTQAELDRVHKYRDEFRRQER